MEEHLPKCLNFEKICEKCEMTYMPNRNPGKEHDCFKELLKRKDQNEKNLNLSKSQLGIDYEKFDNIKCPNGNKLVMHRGTVYQYVSRNRRSIGNPTCDSCSQGKLHEQPFFYRCAEWRTCNCQFDYCRLCAVVYADPPMLPEIIDEPEICPF